MTRDGGRDGFQKRGPPRQGGSSQSYSRGGPGTGGGGPREAGGGSGNRGDSRGSYNDNYGGHNDRSRGGASSGMNRGYNGKAYFSQPSQAQCKYLQLQTTTTTRRCILVALPKK